VTIQQALERAQLVLDAAQITGGRLDSELLLAHVVGKNRAWIKAHDTDTLTSNQSKAYDELIARRAKHVPVVHLTGTREFYGMDFAITPDVLTPRIETEQMVEWAIKHAPQSSSLIDIGTGSGAIAIAIASNRPDLSVAATEVTKEALDVARNNAKKHAVEIEFIKSDLWNNVPGRFDTVVTNLPYLPDDAEPDLMPEVRLEPKVALFGGSDGLDLYRRFLSSLPQHLSPDGYLFTEADPWQHESLMSLAAEQGLSPIEQGYFILGFRQRTN
jgi:release factor glutamine methyltransferase